MTDSKALVPQTERFVDFYGDRINLLLLESGALVNGLVLLLRDGTSTAVFANIHGNLDPVIIGQLIGSGQGMNDLDLGGLMEQFQN